MGFSMDLGNTYMMAKKNSYIYIYTYTVYISMSNLSIYLSIYLSVYDIICSLGFFGICGDI